MEQDLLENLFEEWEFNKLNEKPSFERKYNELTND